MGNTGMGEQLIGWYGNVAAKKLQKDPIFVRRWLEMGFRLMSAKSSIAPDRRQLPSGRHGYALFMNSVVDAIIDAKRSVLTSIFTPNEIFHAMGLKPVTAEAVASFASGAQAERAFIGTAEGSGIPETFCSYHKTLMGMAESGVLEPRRLVASTSVACDANNLTFRALAKRWDCGNAYIDVPAEVSEDSMRYVADQLREMARLTQEVFGTKLGEESLRALVDRSLATDRLLEQTLPMRRNRYLANTLTLDMMEMLDFHLMLGTPEAEHLAQDMVGNFRQAKPFSGINLVWAHVSPYFLGSIAGRLNYQESAQVVASDMMFDHLSPASGLIFDATRPFEAMAERLVRNCFNGPAARRIETLRRLADTTDADGVVVFCHWGCKQTSGAAQLMRAELEKAGYPVLVMDGDAVDRQNCMEGQMATRFDAFMEMVQKAKEARHDIG